jgi:hypothetical protein
MGPVFWYSPTLGGEGGRRGGLGRGARAWVTAALSPGRPTLPRAAHTAQRPLPLAALNPAACHPQNNETACPPLLEEVGLPGQADELHPVKGVGDAVGLVAAQHHQQAVGDVLNVLAHELGVHANQVDRQRLGG